jgi:hypothetical protein
VECGGLPRLFFPSRSRDANTNVPAGKGLPPSVILGRSPDRIGIFDRRVVRVSEWLLWMRGEQGKEQSQKPHT